MYCKGIQCIIYQETYLNVRIWKAIGIYGEKEKKKEGEAHVYIEDNINWELRARTPVAVRSHLLLLYFRQTKGIDLLYPGEKDSFGRISFRMDQTNTIILSR